MRNAHNSRRRAEEELELTDLRADVAAIRDDFAKLIKDLGTTGVQSLKQKAHRAGDAVSAYASRENVSELSDRVVDVVSRRPVTCLLAAVGVGALLFTLLGNSDTDE
ncbi:MAG: hypothetical protein SFZ24_04370 [Planctomycetota bacterium]|nr:hypothetical protein [Planctomycetota bacterium]